MRIRELPLTPERVWRALSKIPSGRVIWKQNSHYEKVIKAIAEQKNDLIDLCLQLGNTPSFHAQERKLGEAVLQWLGDAGIKGELQFITERERQCGGHPSGSGGGKSLIWNAHMDTGPELGPDATEDDRKLETAWIDGDMLFGKGMINDKAQLCAFMIAMRAIKQCDIELKGDLTLTAVAFETGDPSVDQQQGINFPGEGFGTKWVVDRGVVADYALVGETSGFGIVQAECGAGWYKVRVKGREVYTPRLERGTSVQENPNAFVKAVPIISAIEAWAVDYEKRETMKFAGGKIIPKAQIVEVRGGGRVDRAESVLRYFYRRAHRAGEKSKRHQKRNRGGARAAADRLRGIAVPVFARLHRQECRAAHRRDRRGASIRIEIRTAGAAIRRNQHVARFECFQRSGHSFGVLRTAAPTRAAERGGESRHEDR